MINLKIDPEFQNQIPPLTDDEYRQLEENILKEGKLLSPLIVWNNTLVDGHNRYTILQKHPEICFSTMPLRFAPQRLYGDEHQYPAKNPKLSALKTRQVETWHENTASGIRDYD